MTDSPDEKHTAQHGDKGFDELLSTLEDIVAQLEGGDLPLEEALDHFEQGVSLANRASEVLKSAEMRVEKLIRHKGEIQVTPLDDET